MNLQMKVDHLVVTTILAAMPLLNLHAEPASFRLEYKGPAIVTAATISIVAEDDKADVKASYQLKNGSASPLDVNALPPVLGGGAGPGATLPPLGVQAVPIAYSVPVLGKRLKTLRVDPMILLDRKPIISKIGSLRITSVLPTSAKKIVAVSPAPDGTCSSVSGRLTCNWNRTKAYLQPITIHWTEDVVNLNLTRTVSVDPVFNKATVTIQVKNGGDVAATGIVLRETFRPADIRATLGSGGFSLASAPTSEPRILWSHNVPSISPMGIYHVTYQIDLLRTPIQLEPAAALYLNSIVAATSSARITQELSLNSKSLFMALVGWDLNFTGDDHHIDKIGARVTGVEYDEAADNIAWDTYVALQDKNSDDNYNWSLNTSVIRLPNAFTRGDTTDWLGSSNGEGVHNGSFSSAELKGYSDATVILRGWIFNFTDEDHHMNVLNLRIKNINYNSTTGAITWRTEAEFTDKNSDDNFEWKYSWQIVAIKNGAIVYKTFHGDDNGGTAVHYGSASIPSGASYSKAAVMLRGFRFNYLHEDHHLKTNVLHIQNVEGPSSTGTVSWTAHMTYKDKNGDDDYRWYYDAVVLVADDLEVGDVTVGPYSDKGIEEKSFSRRLADVFAEVTWTNGIRDGTETGVDCGGLSTSQCVQCLSDGVHPGDGPSANLYSLGDPAVVATAAAALIEYAIYKNQDTDTLYAVPDDERADLYVHAVAMYVYDHMTWWEDGGDWEGAQTAKKTINSSGSRCPDDMCGDCEDMSILRSSLLRTMGMSWQCVFSADHDNDVHQGQRDECSYDADSDSSGHVFNIVYYKGKYRILDDSYMFVEKHRYCWDQNAANGVWNDHYSSYGANRLRPIADQLLMNFPGNPVCPSSSWNWRTYYGDICK